MSFSLGANLPWVRYGSDFGANAWSPEGGFATRPADQRRVREALARLAATGVDTVRWFFFCDLRAGVRFHGDGSPIEIQPAAWKDIEAVVEVVSQAGLQLMPVIFDFHLCRPRRYVNGVQIRGRSRLLAHADLRARLLDNVVGPLVASYGHHPAIAAWDLFNEPEWATFTVGTWNPVSSVSKAAMRAFLGDAATRARELTRHKVTVGSASTATLDLVRGLGLDFYQPHWYDRLERRAPLTTPTSALGCDRPIVLGEFPTSNSARTPDELIAAAERSGYAGAYFWSALADDEFTHFDHATAALARRIPTTRA